MSSKDYRELQLSSSQLVVIFLAIIILGVIIFLLGISVGKKRTEIVLASQTGSEVITQKVSGGEADPVGDNTSQPAQEKTAQEPQEVKPAPKNQPQSLDWYIQVGAFYNREGAQTTAEALRSKNLQVVILEPYASDRRDVFRVRIGGYASKELAERAKAELARSDPKANDYFVIRQR